MPRSSPDATPQPTRWVFQARFRRNAFGWKSEPAITRVKEAVTEIKAAARKDPRHGAEGAVLFLERVAPALEHVDGSSGAMGTAVRKAVTTLAGLIAATEAEDAVRDSWLERLMTAYLEDGRPWIESLGEHWGSLCGNPHLASQWADRMMETVRWAWTGPRDEFRFAKETTPCLAALFQAGRYAEILDLLALRSSKFWSYQRWGAKALLAMDRPEEAFRFVQAGIGREGPEPEQAQVCEDILLAQGREEEAYRDWAYLANRAGTHLATFRAIQKRYPGKTPAVILADLVTRSRGEEGKWFAAAKDAGLLQEAADLAQRTPCDPRTLTRAARDHVFTHPAFAVQCGLAAILWLAKGYGFDITSVDVWEAYRRTMEAGNNLGQHDATKASVKRIVGMDRTGVGFVTRILASELELPS
jgi:hypothetical protein